MESPRSTPAISLLLEYLQQEGVDRLFGIPGGPIMPLYASLYESGKILPVLAKHEEGAAFMADGYARASGLFGVCCATAGPGATNALTGIAVAYADHVPVLLLTAQVPTSQFGKGAFQECSPEGVDVVGLYRPITKWSTMLPHPDRIGPVIRQAIRTMTTGRPGPVHINLPLDFMTRPVREEVLPPSSYRFGSASFDRAAVRAAALRLLEARRPAVLAGQGVNSSRAWLPLKALAERLGLPVATTFKAKGAFPEDHPLSLGVFGYSGAPRALEYLLSPETDLILVVGTSLGEASSCGWDERLAGKRLLQVDIEPSVVARNFPVDVALVGDAATILVELRYQLERQLQGAALPLRPAFVAGPPEPLDEAAGGGPLKPASVLKELREALPRDSIVFVDNGTIRLWTARHFPVYQEGCFFVNMGMASMGYAVAASIGAKLAKPGRTVVALAGDAAFAMNGMEVHTAVEHDAPVIWVVINNGGHAMIYHGERMQFGGRFRSSVFREGLDVAGMARAMRAEAFRVERPGELREAIAEAAARRRPAVVDVATDLYEQPPMASRVKALDRLAGLAAP